MCLEIVWTTCAMIHVAGPFMHDDNNNGQCKHLPRLPVLLQNVGRPLPASPA
jgi:hypothetical protein